MSEVVRIQEFCTDPSRIRFSRLSRPLQEDFYRIAQIASRNEVGKKEYVQKVIAFYIADMITQQKPLTDVQYLEYEHLLRVASKSSQTLDFPNPVSFTKNEISSRIKYSRPKTLGLQSELIYVDINELVKYMGTDDTALAHTKLYTRNSTDLLAWLLDGVHFHAHKPKCQDISYGKNRMSFIKYLLTADRPSFEIPKINYTPSNNAFDIIDGRHRLGLYIYFNINGPVYTNKSGFEKLKELGGRSHAELYPQTVNRKVDHKKSTDTQVESFKRLGVWEMAIKAVKTTNSEKEALKVPPAGLGSYGQRLPYKRAIRYIYETKRMSVLKSPRKNRCIIM